MLKITDLPEVWFTATYGRIPTYQINESPLDEWEVIPPELKQRIITWNQWFLDNYDEEQCWTVALGIPEFTAQYYELARELRELGLFTVVTQEWWPTGPGCSSDEKPKTR